MKSYICTCAVFGTDPAVIELTVPTQIGWDQGKQRVHVQRIECGLEEAPSAPKDDIVVSSGMSTDQSLIRLL